MRHFVCFVVTLAMAVCLTGCKQEQQQANALAMEQNDLLDRQNSIAEKARRDANIAAAVGAVQRHNTNKTIKKWMEK